MSQVEGRACWGWRVVWKRLKTGRIFALFRHWKVAPWLESDGKWCAKRRARKEGRGKEIE